MQIHEDLPDEEMPDQVLQCPTCGGSDFRYGEYVWSWRRVVGWTPEGTLQVDGLAEVEWEASLPHEAMIYCSICVIPVVDIEKVAIEWI